MLQNNKGSVQVLKTYMSPPWAAENSIHTVAWINSFRTIVAKIWTCSKHELPTTLLKKEDIDQRLSATRPYHNRALPENDCPVLHIDNKHSSMKEKSNWSNIRWFAELVINVAFQRQSKVSSISGNVHLHNNISSQLYNSPNSFSIIPSHSVRRRYVNSTQNTKELIISP